MRRVHLVRLVVISLGFIGASAAEPCLAQSSDVAKSVVKVLVTRRPYDQYRPWMRREASETSGSGVVIEGKRILTNAHVVDSATQVQIITDSDPERRWATVEAKGAGIDVAVLKLEDESFFDAHPALPLAEALPHEKDSVEVHGFPMGGQTLSVTKGIVSRVEYEQYWYEFEATKIQVDAAINPGNSGGPAIADGKVIGLAFSGLSPKQADNIGYLIPAVEVRFFLAGVADGAYKGRPRLAEFMTALENPVLRERVKLPADRSGVLVARRSPDPAHQELREWDVITHAAGRALDSKGRLETPEGHRLYFEAFLPTMVKEGAVDLTVWRDGAAVEVRVPVIHSEFGDTPFSLVRYSRDRPPSYWVCGPIVLGQATQRFLNLSPEWINNLLFSGSPLLSGRRAVRTPECEELVLLPSGLFPHRKTAGVQISPLAVLTHINGTPVRSLRHAIELVRDGQSEFIDFEFARQVAPPLCVKRSDLEAITRDVMAENNIPARCSDDLKDLEKPDAK